MTTPREHLYDEDARYRRLARKVIDERMGRLATMLQAAQPVDARCAWCARPCPAPPRGLLAAHSHCADVAIGARL